MRRALVALLMLLVCLTWRAEQPLSAAVCGDLTCHPGDGETNANCPSDCFCGDGECFVTEGENADNCVQDCGDAQAPNVFFAGSLRIRIVGNTYGMDWTQNGPNPNAPPLGDCAGNCGAGCSDHNNPGCGPDDQEWTLEVLQPPTEGIRTTLCQDNNRYHILMDGYTGTVRWTYNGWRTDSCGFHDAWCPEYTFLMCAVFFGCGPGQRDSWSYDTIAYTPHSSSVIESVDYNFPNCLEECDPGKGGC